MMRNRVLIGNAVYPPLGYLFAPARWCRIGAAAIIVVMICLMVYSYILLFRFEDSLALPRAWWALQWMKLHLLLYTPFGFTIPMKLLYLVVLLHSCSLQRNEPGPAAPVP